MPDNTIPTRAFTTKAAGLINRLLNKVIISYNGARKEVFAIWDTGATGSCISTEVAEQLKLIPTGMKNIQTPSGGSTVNTYVVDIILPNNVRIPNVEVCDSVIGTQRIGQYNLGMLIGMDIINLGDFAVSNHNGQTAFSFRMPSMQTIDYVKQANVANIIGQKHGSGKRKRSKN